MKEKELTDDLLLDPNDPFHDTPNKKVKRRRFPSDTGLVETKTQPKPKRFNPFVAYFNYWVEVISA